MKKNILLWQFSGFAVASLLGTLFHFLYEWTGKNKVVAIFSGIDESTWQHMKLLYFPLLIFAVIQSFYFKNYKNYWCVKMIGFIIGLSLIPIIYYTYNGIFGKSPDWINIAIFFVSAAATFAIEALLFIKRKPDCKYKWFAICLIILFGILFVVFTFSPPDIPIFEPPKKMT